MSDSTTEVFTSIVTIVISINDSYLIYHYMGDHHIAENACVITIGVVTICMITIGMITT